VLGRLPTIASARSASPAEGLAEVEIFATLQVSGSRIRNPTDFSLGPQAVENEPAPSLLRNLGVPSLLELLYTGAGALLVAGIFLTVFRSTAAVSGP
jgi:hypothetical protein